MDWKRDLDDVKSRLIEFEASRVYIEDDDDDDDPRRREQPDEMLVSILHDACEIVRRLKAADYPDTALAIERVNDLVNRSVARQTNAAGGSPHIASFAHAEDALIWDVIQDRMFANSNRQKYRDLAAIMGLDVGRVDEFIASQGPPLPPWSKGQQPHPQTTLLSRFRDTTNFPSSATHPLANIVWQARCEVDNDSLQQTDKLLLSKDGSFMAAAGCGGYKNRDPELSYWFMDAEYERGTTTPPIAHQITDITLDDDRKLLFITDYDRIKSYSFAPESRMKAIHTLNSGKHLGPLAVLPGGRIVKAGKGSALVWDIDALETHYDGGSEFKTIGDKYQGFDNSWREVGCRKELSSGSAHHATIAFADDGFQPEKWERHAPTGHMLCAEDQHVRDRYDFVSLDLEHGGKVAHRFVGHGDVITQISVSEGDPYGVVTSSEDGYARLWDIREPLPVLTLDVERHKAICHAAVYVHVDGLPGVFTGGSASQSVRFWDVRAKKLVYELSTGNNVVDTLTWNAPKATLYAATSSEYSGGGGQYRRAKKVKHDAPKDGEGDAEMGDAQTEETEYHPYLRWPKEATHLEDHFGVIYNAGKDVMFRYAFKENVDMDITPKYGKGSWGEH